MCTEQWMSCHTIHTSSVVSAQVPDAVVSSSTWPLLFPCKSWPMTLFCICNVHIRYILNLKNMNANTFLTVLTSAVYCFTYKIPIGNLRNPYNAVNPLVNWSQPAGFLRLITAMYLTNISGYCTHRLKMILSFIIYYFTLDKLFNWTKKKSLSHWHLFLGKAGLMSSPLETVLLGVLNSRTLHSKKHWNRSDQNISPISKCLLLHLALEDELETLIFRHLTFKTVITTQNHGLWAVQFSNMLRMLWTRKTRPMKCYIFTGTQAFGCSKAVCFSIKHKKNQASIWLCIGSSPVTEENLGWHQPDQYFEEQNCQNRILNTSAFVVAHQKDAMKWSSFSSVKRNFEFRPDFIFHLHRNGIAAHQHCRALYDSAGFDFFLREQLTKAGWIGALSHTLAETYDSLGWTLELAVAINLSAEH